MPSLFRWKMALIGVLVVAFGLRAGVAFGLQYHLDHDPKRDFLIAGDAQGYWELAQQVATGKPFEIYEPPRRILRMPGFPCLLAVGIRLFPDNMLMMRLLLSLVGTFACYLVFRLGEELADPQIGILAAAMAAMSPMFVGFTPLILSETLFAATLMMSLIALARFIHRGRNARSFGNRLGWAGFAGFLVGVATLVRPSWLLVAPGVAVLYWWFENRSTRGAMIAATVVLGLITALTPWMVRNYRVTGHIVPTTLWVGASMYDGLNPQATGISDMDFVETDGVYQRMSEYDADRHYRKLAWDFSISNPGRAIQLAGTKIARYWSPWPNALQLRRWWLVIPLGAYFFFVFFFATVGFWLSRRNYWLCLWTVGPVLYFSCIHTVFVGSIRYRMPAEYPLMVLAAVGLRHVWTNYRVAKTPTSAVHV